MTKQQEIEILDGAIRQLGCGSYLAPWLSSVRGEVESLVRSDMFPELCLRASISEAAEAAKAILELANRDATKITQRAQQIEADAYKEASAIRDRVADAIRAAERAINR